MAAVSKYVEAPYQGVSQAPPQVRLPTQAQALEDTLVSIPQGAEKRQPFTYLCKLKDHPGDTDGVFHYVNREGASDVILTVTREAAVTVPRVYELDGLPQAYDVAGWPGEAITIEPEAQAYLDTSTVPSSDLRALTVVDYTLITNRLNTVANQAGTVTARNPEGMLWVRQSAYGRTYQVTVNPAGGVPVVVTLTTPDGTVATNAPYVDTDVIAASMVSGVYPGAGINGGAIAGNLAALAGQGFTVTRIGAVISLVRSTGEFTMDVEDGQAGVAFLAIKDRVQRFSDLPQKAVDGFTVRITQQSGQDTDDFYVHYVESAGVGTGTWEETIKPGSELGLDPETMPVGLVFELGAWNLKILPWSSRLTGDELLSPDPDFVGQSVQDLTFWRGRLTVLSGEGVTLSGSKDPFQTYPETLSSVLDSDPVSLLSPFPEVSLFRYAIGFDQRLIVFGDTAQAQVTADGILSPSSARIDILTSYEFAQQLRPQASNGKLYFAAPVGTASSAILEMQVDRVANVTDADPLTTSVPRYVPSTIDRVANCPVNYLEVYGTSGGSSLTVHLFRYADKQRVQNAFKRWNLPAGFTLGGMFFKNTLLYVLACKGGAAHLLRADISPDVLDDDAAATMLTHLDMRMKEDQVLIAYSALTDRTILTLPFDRTDDIRVVSRAPGGVGGPSLTEDGPIAAPEGFPADVLLDESALEADNEVVLLGDWTACPLWIGFKYTSRITLSRFYVLGQDDRPLRSGRLALDRMAVDVADTGYLRAEVTIGGRAVRNYEFTGYQYDNPDSVYNQPPSVTKVFKFPLGGENESVSIDLVNDSHFPSKVLGYEWRGRISPKASRVG